MRPCYLYNWNPYSGRNCLNKDLHTKNYEICPWIRNNCQNSQCMYQSMFNVAELCGVIVSASEYAYWDGLMMHFYLSSSCIGQQKLKDRFSLSFVSCHCHGNEPELRWWLVSPLNDFGLCWRIPVSPDSRWFYNTALKKYIIFSLPESKLKISG